MKRRKLGRTDLLVSELCLSTTQFGWLNNEAAALALLDAYHRHGGSFIQNLGFCPDAATTCLDESPSEEWVGRWLHARSVPRDRLVLAARLNLFRPVHGGSIAFANRIRWCCEQSLRRLRTSHLDLLICEWDDQLAPIDDLIDAIDMLIRAGVVRYAVASGFPPWRVVDSLYRSGIRNRSRIEAVQMQYSLMTRSRFETEAMGMCGEHRLGFLALSPLAGGFLAQRPVAFGGCLRPERRWLDERFSNQSGDAVLAVLSEIADKKSAFPAQVALAWLLRNPQVTSAIISAASPDELRGLLGAADLTLTDAETGELANVTTVQDYRMELRHA